MRSLGKGLRKNKIRALKQPKEGRVSAINIFPSGEGDWTSGKSFLSFSTFQSRKVVFQVRG
jgi:hypothetical protein